MNNRLNIVVIGKSGVGKSSLLNYLIGKELFRTGIGEPVTADYFEEKTFVSPANRVEYHLYDTKGIEPTTTREVKELVFGRINKCDKSENVFDWIHSMYYCFAASSKRIEPFEIDFIKSLRQKVNVIIILTKKDLVSKDDLIAIQNQINKEFDTDMQVIPVCSVSTRTRKSVSVQDGKEKVLKHSFYGLWKKLEIELPNRLEDVISVIDEPSLETNKMAVDTITTSSNNLNDCKINFQSLWKKNKEIVSQVLHLYEKINESPIKKMLNKSTEKLFDDVISAFDNAIASLNKSVIPQDSQVPQGLISKMLIKSIIPFVGVGLAIDDMQKYHNKQQQAIIDEINRIFSCLTQPIHSFVESFQKELEYYGYYCVRDENEELSRQLENDEFVHAVQKESVVIDDIELTDNEKTYYFLLMDALKNGFISESERDFLHNLKEKSGISDFRAGRIEDFARSGVK
jgi:small GTP-binding protein